MFKAREQVPVVKTGSLQLFIVGREAERVDEVQGGPGRGTEARDVASVRRNLWFNQGEMEHCG